MTRYHRPVIRGYTVLPKVDEPGSFGAVRKYDIHTGVDVYCEFDAGVYAMEDGTVVAIEKFTGQHADSPWWNDTWALLVEGKSGVIVYGELEPLWSIKVGDRVIGGRIIGHVIPVLKRFKGVTPTTMLHVELHRPGTTKTCWWHHGDALPDTLLDPTEMLKEAYESSGD